MRWLKPCRPRWTQAQCRLLEERSFGHPVQRAVVQVYVGMLVDAQHQVSSPEDLSRQAVP